MWTGYMTVVLSSTVYWGCPNVANVDARADISEADGVWLFSGCSSLLLPLVSGSSPNGPIVYCTSVSSDTRTFQTALLGVRIHARVLYKRRIKPKVWKMHLPRRGMMCSPWETPLCCTGTRRRFSVLGKSAKTETQVRDTLPVHAAGFLPFTLRFPEFLGPKNESSGSTRILQSAVGPDTLREAGLGSCSGEVEEAVVLGRGKWRRQIEIPTGSGCCILWLHCLFVVVFLNHYKKPTSTKSQRRKTLKQKLILPSLT